MLGLKAFLILYFLLVLVYGLDYLSVVGNIQSIIVRGHRPEQGVGFGHISVTDFLHSFFDLVFAGLTSIINTSMLPSLFSVAGWSGELGDDIAVSPVFLEYSCEVL